MFSRLQHGVFLWPTSVFLCVLLSISLSVSQGLPDPQTVSSSIQQMWALTEVMQTNQTTACIGRFDVRSSPQRRARLMRNINTKRYISSVSSVFIVSITETSHLLFNEQSALPVENLMDSDYRERWWLCGRCCTLTAPRGLITESLCVHSFNRNEIMCVSVSRWTDATISTCSLWRKVVIELSPARKFTLWKTTVKEGIMLKMNKNNCVMYNIFREKQVSCGL